MKINRPILTATLVSVAIAIHLLPVEIAAALQFDRAAIVQGQSWRLITGHFTHFGTNHLAWDVTVFLALGVVSELTARWRTALALLASSISVSVAVLLWQPQFAIYRGLSGLDCALFGLFTAPLFRRHDAIARLLGAAASLGILAKCAFELSSGHPLFASGVGYSPVPLAHLVGFITGFAVQWLPPTNQSNRADLLGAKRARFSDNIDQSARGVVKRRSRETHASPHALRARSRTPVATARARSAPSRSTAST
jgi:rhomboid family GlyGly-CTERM serine protease